MPSTRPFRLKVVTSRKALRLERRPARPARTDVRAKPAEIVRAFKRSAGTAAILQKFPNADTVAVWQKQVAFFSVAQKSGSAVFLDLWDCDHFDGLSDMQRSIAMNRAWFSHTGFTTWGSAQTATGRINCFFNAPADGQYSCVVKLESFPGSASARVECLIDNSSFGPLTFSGVRTQPHFSFLSKGGHHFRIRQQQGAFFFLSLTVFRFV